MRAEVPKANPENRTALIKSNVRPAEKQRLLSRLPDERAQSNFIRNVVLKELDRLDAIDRGEVAPDGEGANGRSLYTAEEVAQITGRAVQRAVFDTMMAMGSKKSE